MSTAYNGEAAIAPAIQRGADPAWALAGPRIRTVGAFAALRRACFWPAAITLTSAIVLLSLLYIGIPEGLSQPPGWSPRPNHSVEVAQLYRAHLYLANLRFGAEQVRLLNTVLLGFAALGYTVLLWSRPQGVQARVLLLLGGPLALSTVLMPPLYATDIFYYGISGELVARFGANPYLMTPAEFPTSALLPFNYWTSITSPYGPIWTQIAAGVALLSGGEPFAATLLLKVLGALTVLATGIGINRFLHWTNPSAARFGTMLFVLNPFVWLVSVGDMHADTVMAALMVGAACLLARRRGFAAWCCIAAATLVKYLTAPVLPLFFLARLSRPFSVSGWLRPAAVLGISFAVLSAVTWAPFWAGPATLSSLLDEGGRGYSSPPLLLFLTWGARVGLPDWTLLATVGMASSLMLMTLVGGIGWMARCTYRARAAASVINEVRMWALTMLLVAALLPRSHPWYLLTGLALLAAAHPATRRTTAVAYAASGAWLLWRVAPI
jgi:hypothetical protein